MNTKVVTEPYDGGPPCSGGVRGVGGAAGVQSKGILKWVCGDGGFERGFGGIEVDVEVEVEVEVAD